LFTPGGWALEWEKSRASREIQTVFAVELDDEVCLTAFVNGGSPGWFHAFNIGKLASFDALFSR
jgi:hypothetical protein